MMEYQNDPFYIASGNCNVIYVNDLTWYLEKVLWKLGMHRKGRKEFMSVSQARRRLTSIAIDMPRTDCSAFDS